MSLDLDTKIVVEGDKMHVGRFQDCTPIAEYAKAMHREGYHGSNEMKFAGTIPYVFIEKYCNDKGVAFHEFMSNKEHIRAVLNDPALADFRIWKGRL